MRYINKSTTIDGITFASLAEGRRYQELKALKLAHKIKNFEMQPRYLLQPAFRKCPACLHMQEHTPGSQKKHDVLCHECGIRTTVIESMEYVADFLVFHADGTETVEDVKGSRGYMDPVFRIKQKLFEYKYPDKTIKIVIMPGRKKKCNGA